MGVKPRAEGNGDTIKRGIYLTYIHKCSSLGGIRRQLEFFRSRRPDMLQKTGVGSPDLLVVLSSLGEA
jgi:hypothetical protein